MCTSLGSTSDFNLVWHVLLLLASLPWWGFLFCSSCLAIVHISPHFLYEVCFPLSFTLLLAISLIEALNGDDFRMSMLFFFLKKKINFSATGVETYLIGVSSIVAFMNHGLYEAYLCNLFSWSFTGWSEALDIGPPFWQAVLSWNACSEGMGYHWSY